MSKSVRRDLFLLASAENLDEMCDLYETIEGRRHPMTPPSTAHQRVLGNLFAQLARLARGMPYEVYLSMFEVRLDVQGQLNIVRPDIIVVDTSQVLDERGFSGIPALVVEVITVETALRDRREKLHLYEQAGIARYWVVDPVYLTLQEFTFGQNRSHDACGPDAWVKVDALDGSINLADVFL